MNYDEKHFQEKVLRSRIQAGDKVYITSYNVYRSTMELAEVLRVTKAQIIVRLGRQLEVRYRREDGYEIGNLRGGGTLYAATPELDRRYRIYTLSEQVRGSINELDNLMRKHSRDLLSQLKPLQEHATVLHRSIEDLASIGHEE